VGASGGAGRRAQALVLGASSEITSVRFWPGFRALRAVRVRLWSIRRFGASVGEATALLAWRVGRSFRLGPARGAVPGGRHVAGPQPNNVCCWQPGLAGSLRSLLLNRLQQKLIR
jgi:hypothetical protein